MSDLDLDLYLGGVGLFTPGFADAAAYAAGARDPAARLPRAEVLPAALRRRATPLAAMVAEAVAQAAAQADLDLGRVAIVFGSALGEFGIAATMLGEFRQGEGLPSPTRFHNSVHNGPAAYLSIATGNRGFSTAVAAGPETPAAALLEAAALLGERGGAAVVVLADEPPPAPFPQDPAYPPLAVAFALRAAPEPSDRAVLRALRGGGARAQKEAPRVRPELAGHPCAGAVALLEAIGRGAEGPVDLGGAPGRGWTVTVVSRSTP
ncbi:MAG TPA: beta-ketoacyl synthase chain length factor [Anaeromyxobacter sp.]|nr:beta-ketoacyl synthase chain length factor [Anaeromyxobacter sp.]